MSKRLILIFSVCLWCSSAWSQAQTYSIDSILSFYERDLGISFSYDAELMSLINHSFQYQPELEIFIRDIDQALPLSIERLSENYYSLVVKEASYHLKLFDSLDQSSIDPALVLVARNSKPVALRYSEDNIVFEYRPSVFDTLIVYAAGYEPQHISTAELLNKQNLVMPMSYRSFRLTGLTISDYLTKGIDLNPETQGISIEVENLPLLPGETDGDIFASIAALPGVTSPDHRAGNLFIRGSFTDQTLILFDDIPIYHRGHYYGTISPYNPKVVSEVSVYRNGFHTRLGDRVGGAIVINSDEQIGKEDFDIGIGSNSLYATGYGKTSLASGKVGISFAARRSYPLGVTSPKLKAISESVFDATGALKLNGDLVDDLDILFEDYHGKIGYQINSKNRLSLSSIFTNTRSSFSKEPTDLLSGSYEEGKNQNIGVNLKWDSQITNRWKSQLSSTYSLYEFSYLNQVNQEDAPPNLSNNNLKDLNLREEFSYAHDKYRLDLGVDYKWQEVVTDYSNYSSVRDVLFELRDTVASHSLASFINIDWNPWEKFFIRAGIRGNYYSQLKTFKVDPRLFLTYTAADWLTLKASTGRYHQYLSQIRNMSYAGGGFENELWTLADDENGHIISGTQSSAGALFHQQGWVLEVEAYLKRVEGMSMASSRGFTRMTTIFTADQMIRGVDFMLKKRLNPEMNLWASYTYSQSKIQLDTSDVTYTSKYVQPHVLFLGASYNRARWSISASWRLSSGLYQRSLDMYQTKFTQQRMNRNNPNFIDPTEGISGRYPDMQSLDISASYRITKKPGRDWSMSFGVSLINVLNQDNLIDEVHRDSNWLERHAIGFAPNLMILLEW